MHRARSLSMRSAGSGSAIVVALNPAAWYRYGIGITVTGSGVSQWDDQSGNGRHYLQGTDANRPPKQADGTILFDGVADFVATGGFTLNQPWTRFTLLRQVTWTNGQVISDGLVLGSSALVQQATTPRIRLQAGAAGTENANLILNTYAVVVQQFNAASSFVQVNNTAAGPSENVGAGNPGGLTLGSGGGGVGVTNIQVYEDIAFASALSAQNIAFIKTYLGNIAGLTL